MKTVLIVLMSFVAGGCATSRAKPLVLTPLRLKVVDAATEQPVKGATVLYALQTVVMHEKIAGLVHPHDPDIGQRLALKLRGQTNQDGEAVFATQGFELKDNERFDKEFVFVNVDVDMARRLSQIVIEGRNESCRDQRPTCGGPANEVDVAWSKYLLKEDREETFLPPRLGHKGLVLMIAPPEHYDPTGWPGSDEKLVKQFLRMNRANEEVIVVKLEQYDK